MTRTQAVALALATLGAGVASEARAVELYPNEPTPRRVIVVPAPVPHPEPAPVRVVRRPETRVTLRVRDDGRRPAPTRDDGDGPRLVLGGGVGPMFVIGAPGDPVVPIGHLHLGLAVHQVEVGLRVGLAPYAATLENAEGRALDTGLYTTDVTFTYRFLPDADVHPILGAGLGAVIAAPDGSAPSAGFGVSARAGLELGVDVPDGELGVGLDALGTQVVGAEEGFPWALGTSLTIGAHLDYRF
ncbi:MAG TPA: hypothetical protein RMH99_13460 [Sandaracinaceae bacterium LLY-WYZ-13_1]|nr:hypothetical protein [Sandaracinaceae bacterium LLY-WYZ-13_1]